MTEGVDKIRVDESCEAKLENYDIAMRLMSAASFERRGETFHWQNEEHVTSLLRIPSFLVPRNARGLSSFIKDDSNVAERRNSFKKLSWNGATYRHIYQVKCGTGDSLWVEESGQRIEGDGVKPTLIRGIIRDIDRDVRAQEKAAYLADHDPLTGMFNLDRLSLDLQWNLRASRRLGTSVQFYAVKLSNIDDIILTYGYEAGDQLTSAVADRLRQHIDMPDAVGFLAKQGFEGIVFGICFAQNAHQDAKALSDGARDLIAFLSDMPYSSPYGDLYASFAISGVDAKGALASTEILNQARIALEHSYKRHGVFVAYEDGLVDPLKKNLDMPVTSEDILGALNSRDVKLAYQPIVHSDTRKIHHFECLLRLRQPDGQVVPAGRFIMAAEDLGLVHLLDRRALELASDTLLAYPDIKLAVNVSAATLANEVAVSGYISMIRSLGSAASRLIVELTETAALEDPAMASGFSSDVRALGCTFAIDDFGAGYTTFQNLMAIEADEIKIDGSFITDLSVTPHKQVFVRMMVDLAQTFNVQTVAEFVNTPEDADLLTRLGVDYLQGYMFGVPSASPQGFNSKPDPLSSSDATTVTAS